jgi:hypothetical protein
MRAYWVFCLGGLVRARYSAGVGKGWGLASCDAAGETGSGGFRGRPIDTNR